MRYAKKNGFSLTEIIVTLSVSSLLIGYLLIFSRSLVSNTHNSLAYYQALQLAHETLDWVRTIPADMVDEQLCAALSDSITDYGTLKAINLPVSSVNNKPGGSIKYPDSYAKSWFLRQIKVERFKGEKGRFLVKVSVTVSWNESKEAKKLNSNIAEARMRNLTLTTALFDENGYY